MSENDPSNPTAGEAEVKTLAAPPAVQRWDRDGRERPAFILAFPRDPALDELVTAFEAGNFAFVRKAAPRLAQEATNPEVRAAALELRRRIDPDPSVVFLLVLAILLLVFLALWAYA